MGQGDGIRQRRMSRATRCNNGPHVRPVRRIRRATVAERQKMSDRARVRSDVVVARVMIVRADGAANRIQQRQMMRLPCEHREMFAQDSPELTSQSAQKGTRYSRGAFGFMSHMSTCDAPPLRKKRIVERALPRRCADDVLCNGVRMSKAKTRNARG